MKFNIIYTATIVSTGILLSAVATPAFAQGRGGNSSGSNSSGGGGSVASACPNVAGTPLCLGAFSGNDTGAQGTALMNLNSLTGFSNWTLAGKSDNGFGTFLSGGHGSQQGVWSTGLSGAGAFSVKAGTGYLLFQTNDISTINWSTLGLVNNGGQTPGLSHLSVFTGGPGGGSQKEVPEPLTLLGSGLALGFGGMFQKKRNANKSAK